MAGMLGHAMNVQPPCEHGWLVLTTVSGERWILDLAACAYDVGLEEPLPKVYISRLFQDDPLGIQDAVVVDMFSRRNLVGKDFTRVRLLEHYENEPRRHTLARRILDHVPSFQPGLGPGFDSLSRSNSNSALLTDISEEDSRALQEPSRDNSQSEGELPLRAVLQVYMLTCSVIVAADTTTPW